ncbi:cupin domain-containing protein [Streptococcus sp. ZJ93]|uniref:cupin domain-containing protein n=1 Tax=Streptococcus handemini TaxID=3161188 RepID=UPI0032EDE872
MAKLVVAKDISDCHEAGRTICYVDADTIITPAARDEAKKCGISFEVGQKRCEKTSDKGECGISAEELLSLLKRMLATCDKKIEKANLPYRSVVHSNGLKVVKGGTVRMDEFDTGNPEANVSFQELVGKDEAKMSAGFLAIDHSSFAWKLPYEEIDYIISGTVCVEIDGQKYVGREGDVLFIPSGSDVIWSSPDNAKLFYTTYPSNWSDLM